MSGATGLLIKLGVRLVVFTAVFYVAAKKNEKITFRSRWVPPAVGFVFAVLNTALYWLLIPVFDIATLGAIGFVMPLIVNALLLAGTVKIFAKRPEWFQMKGFFAAAWMAIFLTLAHGVLWFGLDFLPNHV